MTTANDSAGEPQLEAAADNPGTSGGKATVADWLTEKKVLPRWVWICLVVLSVAIITITCAAYFSTKGLAVKVYLDEYEEIAFYELSRPLPYLKLTNVDKEDCAKNCTADAELNCQHIQFCADEGEALGVCHLFSGDDTRLRSVRSDNCTIFTRGDPAQFHIPHGGASPFNKGQFQALIWPLFTLLAFKFLGI